MDAAERGHWIVITKDADFVDAHLLHGRPSQLMLISTGNISNRKLEAFFLPNIPELIRGFGAHTFLELGRNGITIRG